MIKKILFLCLFGITTLGFSQENLPFAMMKNAPVYPDCKGDAAQLKECTAEKIEDFIRTNFNTTIIDELALGQKQKRVTFQFTISRAGYVEGIRIKSADVLLDAEGERVIASLPKMKPGKHRGKAKGTLYFLSIDFGKKKKKA